MADGEKILIVEDEKLIRMNFRQLLEEEGYRVSEAANGAEALEHLASREPDLLLLDYKLPDTTGLEILKESRRLHPETGAILMTAYSSIDSAVTAIKLGAYDYLNKPVKHDDLLATISKALQTTRLQREVARLRAEQKREYGITNIIGRSRPMQEVFNLIGKIAGSSATTVLIQGKSGTGKDLVAKAIHFASDRTEKPFMNITCSAISESLMESELFGHERGAFTDAHQQKKGMLEHARGGTVFLDEIGEMGLSLQAKLLRFLEEKAFMRVGGVHDIKVDVRVIAATNQNLQEAVAAGRFREDLYFRLKVIPIHLPSLEDRKEDIPDLVSYFINRYNKELRKTTRGVTDGMLNCLMSYHWPGNVRELKNIIERAMILESKPELDLGDLPEEVFEVVREGDQKPVQKGGGGTGIVLPEGGVSMKEAEYDLIRQALDRTGGNQTKAARLLRISRDALRYKVKKFGLN
jgi:two-component system response regulator AtoC